MARYRIRCSSCGAQDDLIKTATSSPSKVCPTCQGVMSPIPASSKLVQAGDDWVGKGMVLRSQLARMQNRIDSREHHSPTLQPNVKGEEVATWSEAARLAVSQGFDPQPYRKLAEQMGES